MRERERERGRERIIIYELWFLERERGRGGVGSLYESDILSTRGCRCVVLICSIKRRVALVRFHCDQIDSEPVHEYFFSSCNSIAPRLTFLTLNFTNQKRPCMFKKIYIYILFFLTK